MLNPEVGIFTYRKYRIIEGLWKIDKLEVVGK